MEKSMLSIFVLDLKTLTGVLVWGDLALAILIFGYLKFHSGIDEKNPIRFFGIAKFLQFFGWLLLFYRGNVSDLFSIYFGNIILYLSFFIESLVMLTVVNKMTKKWQRIQAILFIIFSMLIILVDLGWGEANLRVVVSSYAIFSLLAIPTFFYIFCKDDLPFKKYVGLYMLVFLIFLFYRGSQALFSADISLFSQSLAQSATFITLILLLFISGAGFLLIMYEKADQKTKALASLDYLTHIPNRRFFMDKAYGYFERHRIAEKPMSVLFIDIDFFKRINDQFGHLAGDEALKQLAKILQESIRPTDLCCRYGGEEFLVLLNETSEEHAMIVGKRIYENAKEINIERNSKQSFTISVGIYSGIPTENDTLEKFIDKSDQTLYRIKESGRNRVALFKEFFEEEENDGK